MLKIQAGLRTLASTYSAANATLEHPEVDPTTGAHTRLQITVPTDDKTNTKDHVNMTGTVVTAGMRLKNWGYDGFNVKTTRHVALAAAGDRTESTMSLQSEGVMHLQATQDSLVTMSAAPTAFTSTAVVNMIGDGGVVISAGAYKTEPYVTSFTNPQPPVIEPFQKFPNYAQALVDGWKATNDAVKTTVKARDQLETDTIPAAATKLEPTTTGMTVPDTSKASIQTPNEIGKKVASSNGSIVVHGKGGLFVDTPASGSVHAQKALVLSSEAPMVLGTKTAHVHSDKTAGLTAGEHVNVIGGKDVHIVAKDDKVHIASRKGKPVEVVAKTVHLGMMVPGPYPQEPTEKVYSRATKHISLETSNDPSGSESTPGVFLYSHEQVKASGAKTVTLEIPGKPVQIVVADSGNKIEIKAITASITLDPSGGVLLKHTVGSCEIKNDKVTVMSGGSQVEVSAGGVKVAGPSIKLG